MRNRVLLFVLIVTTLQVSCSRLLLTKEKFEKVEIGMTVRQVKEILGEPAVIKTADDNSMVYFYYVHNDVWTKDYASVHFDKAGWVSFTSYENPS